MSAFQAYGEYAYDRITEVCHPAAVRSEPGQQLWCDISFALSLASSLALWGGVRACVGVGVDRLA